MNALYTIEEIRRIEAAALAQLPPGTLMRRAGQAVATMARQIVGGTDGKILILAGPGNNGGDALDAAWRLADAGFELAVWQGAEAGMAMPFTSSTQMQQALQRARQSSARFESGPIAIEATAGWRLVIDGLFGIGLRRPLAGGWRAAIEEVNALLCPVLAIDVPSGLNADTGALLGPQGVAIRATHTLTFIGDKPGLHTGCGRDHAGTVIVADLGLEPGAFPTATCHLNDPAGFAAALQPRRHNTHKGSYGDVIVVGGAPGMGGAPLLAARAAALAGAGRVYAAFCGEVPALDGQHPEVMCRAAQHLEAEFSTACLVAGPGLGTSSAARELLLTILTTAAQLVLDADALNLVAAHPELQAQVARRAGQTLVTPHPLEAARLLGTTGRAVQADRLGAARALAQRLQSIVVLKGSGTIIAAPDGEAVVNPTGNPGLATAGSGDVLAGICGALLAQGWPIRSTALGAVWMHGRAADILVEQGIGPIGMTAGELMPVVRTVLNALVNAGAKSMPTTLMARV